MDTAGRIFTPGVSRGVYQWALSLAFTGTVAAYLAAALGGEAGWQGALSGMAMLSVLLAFPRAGMLSKLTGIFFLAAGTALMALSRLPVGRYAAAFGEMAGVLSLMVVMPFLAIPIRIGGYDRLFAGGTGASRHPPFRLFRLLTVAGYFFGCFLNMATLPIVYHSMKAAAEKAVSGNVPRFMAIGIMQGFVLPILWTPLSMSIGVVLELTGARWPGMFPLLLAISLSGLAVSWLVYRMVDHGRFSPRAPADPGRPDGRHPEGRTGDPEGTGKFLAAGAGAPRGATGAPRGAKNAECGAGTGGEAGLPGADGASKTSSPAARGWHMAAMIALLIVLIVTASETRGLSLITVTTVITIPFSLAWSLAIRKGAAWRREVRRHVTRQLPALADSFFLFLSAGYFARAISFSGFGGELNRLMLDFHGLIGTPPFLLALPLLICLLSMCGIHPMVSVVLLAQSLQPGLIGIAPDRLTVALMVGSVMSYAVGPFGGSVAIMAALAGTTPMKVVRWNLAGSFGFYLFTMPMIGLM